MFVWLVAALLAVIPWSERYSMLDNFPHGQDTEFGLLAFLVFLGLMLLLARSCTTFLGVLIQWCEALSLLLRSGCTMLRVIQLPSPRAAGHEYPPGASLAAFILPLKI